MFLMSRKSVRSWESGMNLQIWIEREKIFRRVDLQIWEESSRSRKILEELSRELDVLRPAHQLSDEQGGNEKSIMIIFVLKRP